MPKRFYILGDSHVSAFLIGAKAVGAEDLIAGGGWGNGRVYFDPFFDIEDGRIIPDSDRTHYREWRRRTGRDINDCAGSLIVSMGLSATSLYNAKMWDAFGPGKRPVSDGLLTTLLEDLQAYVLAFYRALIERGLLAASYLPPPVQRDHPVFRRMSAEDVKSLLQRYQAPVRALLEEASIPLIELPVLDEEGFLLPEFAGADPSHASPAIGELAAAALRELAGGTGQSLATRDSVAGTEKVL